jgi:hypothetical protein
LRNRKLLAVLGVALAVLNAVGTFVLWPQEHRISQENFDRIQNGMTQDEVEAILGSPGDYRTGPIILLNGWRSADDDLGFWKPPIRAAWCGDAGFAYGIYDFGEPRRVHSLCFLEASRQPQAPLDNLLWRAKRQWRRWFPAK